VCVAVLLLSACSSNPKPDPYADSSAEAIYAEANENLKKEHYENSVKSYEALEAHFPFGRYTEQGQLEIIYAYYQADEHPAAIAAADRFIRLHPRSAHLDYAYYIKGVVKFNETVTFLEKYLPLDPNTRDLDAEKESYHYFAEFLRRFPDSSYASDARQRMIYIRNSVAESNYHAGVYYYNRGAYLSAANRSNDIIKHYQGAPVMFEALVLLRQSYEKLGFNDLTEEINRIIILNYPHEAIADSSIL